MDTLKLIGMRFYGYHGVYTEEEKLGGQFLVDVELRGDFSYENTHDDLKRSVDLTEVHNLVKEIVCEKRFNLIETLAEEIAELVLGGFGVEEVTVRVRKEAPPIPGSVFAIEALVTRKKVQE
jgi:dihydroneopterin aldolase